VADGTMITVLGNLSVYAKMSYTMGWLGQPLTYGWVALGKNVHIVAEERAIITCYGYITGNSDNSSVTINSGARIHESFQVKDWRGGTATLAMVGSNVIGDKVFPIQQYYVQNVETRLVLHYGAEERISTAAALGESPLYPSASFILPKGHSESSLFKLGSGASIIKYYDAEYDRIKVIVLGESPDASVDIDGIKLELGSSELSSINSADFVLPLSNNYDVSLYNIDVTIKKDLSFLAGSSLSLVIFFLTTSFLSILCLTSAFNNRIETSLSIFCNIESNKSNPSIV
jgi:hypothetical protein